jgi:hypothetical protein
MRSRWILCVVIGAAVSAFAGEPKVYQAGTVLQMDSVPCRAEIGTNGGSASKEDRAAFCAEYVLEADHVTYHIRPRDGKRAPLFQAGDRALFRLQNGGLMLRAETLDAREKAFVVVSMGPRTETHSADAAPVHLNHLQ